MASKAALIAAAMRKSAPPPDVMKAQMRKDKKEAVRIARLKLKANNRGAAPPPPKPGQAPSEAAPDVAVTPAKSDKPVKTFKYRAVADFKSADIEFTVGSVLFVICEADDDGKAAITGDETIAVYNGKSGNVPIAMIEEITAESLKAERDEKDRVASEEAAVAQADAETQQKYAEDKAAKALEALDAKYAAASDTSELDAEKAKIQAEAEQAKAAGEAEIAKIQAEEDDLKKQAAEIEAMLAALGDSSDEEDNDDI